MNPNLLPPSLVTAVALLVAPQITEATIYTFDVDSSSGIGTGFFSIDLPDSWSGNIGHATLIPASSLRGFFSRGDKWSALSVSLNEFIEQPDSAELSGASKKAPSFKIPTRSVGLTPVEAVANLPGVTLRPIGVAPSAVGHHRRSRWLERDTPFRAGWHRNGSKPGLTSGTLSTDRVVDPAAPVLEYTCASPPLPRPPSPHDGLVPKSAAPQTSSAAPSRSVRSNGTRVCHNKVLHTVRQMEDQRLTQMSESGGLSNRGLIVICNSQHRSWQLHFRCCEPCTAAWITPPEDPSPCLNPQSR
jgi:hypothetical protein